MNNRDEKPLVSIVTLNYNGKRFLADLFDALRACSYDNLEIIMVDNDSHDDSVAFVREHYPEVIVHENRENLLYAGGNNEGLKVAKGRYLCLLNNDVTVAADFIEPVVALFEDNEKVAAIQPKILAMKAPDHLEYAGACGGFLDWFGYPFLRGRILETTERDDGQYDSPMKLFWGSGACLFLRKDVIEETGLLDVEFGLHMEEIDLCWRIHLQGKEIWCLPESRIWHLGGGTLPQHNPQKMYWNFRNNIFLLVKNLGIFNLLLRLPLRIMLDVLAMVAEFAKGHFGGGFAIIRAYGWLLSHVGTMLRHRRVVQRQRKVNDREIARRMYPGSVILEYLLLGRKKITNLIFYEKLARRNQAEYSNAINEQLKTTNLIKT